MYLTEFFLFTNWCTREVL